MKQTGVIVGLDQGEVHSRVIDFPTRLQALGVATLETLAGGAA